MSKGKLYEHERLHKARRDAADDLYEALNKCRAIIKFHVKNAGVCCTLAGSDKPFSALEAYADAVKALAKADGEEVSA